jgi:nitronate monooxygenase
MTNVLDELAVPIVQAPLAGGPSTPELAAAVCNAGGLGFVAGGYKTAGAMREDIAQTRAMTDRPFGVNLFAPGGGPADPAAVAAYAERLEPDAGRAGVSLGAPRFDDDDFEAKLAVLHDERVAVASLTFGCPAADVAGDLRRIGTAVWVTVTDVEEARAAAAAGADALVLQGAEAGGHRGSFVDRNERTDYGILALLQLVAAEVDLPLVATGAIATGEAVAAVLVAGAAAAQVGTAFLPGGRDGPGAPRRARIRSRDRPDTRVLGPPGTRDRQPAAGRAHERGADRLSRGPSPHRAAARARAQRRRSGSRQPLGRPGARPRDGGAGGRGRRPAGSRCAARARRGSAHAARTPGRGIALSLTAPRVL